MKITVATIFFSQPFVYFINQIERVYSKNWIFAYSENLRSPFSVRYHGININGVTIDELLVFLQ
jgi:hypothetical protein